MLHSAIRGVVRTAALLVAIAVAVHGTPRAARAGTPAVDIDALNAFCLRSTTGSEVVELPAIGEDIFLSATYRVDGSDTAVPAEVRALIDGVPFCFGDLDLAPNEIFRVLCPTAWRASAGMHTLRWIFDSANEVTEFDEDNNIVEFDFIVADVDLVAERAHLRTGTTTGDEILAPSVGQAVFFHVDYQLNGIEDVVNTGIQAFIDGELGCGGFIDFEPGADRAIYCEDPWIATRGEHTLRWVVDDTDFVSETNEGNNVAELTFTVSGTFDLDLRAVRAFLRADSSMGPEIRTPEPGRPIVVHLDYESTADVTADVSAFLDDDLRCSGTVMFEAGRGALFCPGTWTAVKGAHTLRWVIDESNTVAETDETNNSATLRFGVGTPVECPGDCNDNGVVTSDELVRGIMIMLGLHDLDACSAFDADLSSEVTIDEAVSAIDRASEGCGTP